MFEAARWAPSAFNSQPWHFLYAKRGDANWERFLSLLIPWNRSWAHTASVLVYIVSDSLPITDRKTGEPAPSTTHSFDAGAAWVSLALQATRMGYHAHGMSGIQYDLARAELGLPDRYQLNAACVDRPDRRPRPARREAARPRVPVATASRKASSSMPAAFRLRACAAPLRKG